MVLLFHNVVHSYMSSMSQNVALCGNWLTLYYMILTFNDPEKESFWKHYGKRRKWKSPFPTMFSTLLKTVFNFWVTFILMSESSFSLDSSKILSCGIGLSFIVESCSGKRGLNASPLCVVLRKTSPNYWSLKIHGFKQLNDSSAIITLWYAENKG